ncbi:unnamed protein product [Cunninghamella blakesleeana]
MATYTFFREKSGGSARVYYGTFEKEEQINQPVAYRINMTKKISELYDGRNNNEPILRSRYLDSKKEEAIIEGYHTEFKFTKSGFLSEKWKWSDPLNKNKSYKWEIDVFGSRWKLKDDDNNTLIASFQRSDFSFRKQGVLTVYYQVDPFLLSCIILSHKIIHQRVKKDEEKELADEGEEGISNIFG